MENRKICKRCLLREAGEQGEYEQVKAAVSRLSEKEKAPPEAYAERLVVCESCEHLIKGTCMKCGCYVELRAALTKGSCPKKRWRL